MLLGKMSADRQRKREREGGDNAGTDEMMRMLGSDKGCAAAG